MLVAIIATMAYADVAPAEPAEPAGCEGADMVLVTDADGKSYWVFVGC